MIFFLFSFVFSCFSKARDCGKIISKTARDCGKIISKTK